MTTAPEEPETPPTEQSTSDGEELSVYERYVDGQWVHINELIDNVEDIVSRLDIQAPYHRPLLGDNLSRTDIDTEEYYVLKTLTDPEIFTLTVPDEYNPGGVVSVDLHRFAKQYGPGRKHALITAKRHFNNAFLQGTCTVTMKALAGRISVRLHRDISKAEVVFEYAQKDHAISECHAQRTKLENTLPTDKALASITWAWEKYVLKRKRSRRFIY